MTDLENKILIIEYSEIIRQGLVRIIQNSLPEFNIMHLSSVGELSNSDDNDMVLLLIINSSFFENMSMMKDVMQLFPQARLIGIVTQSLRRDDTALFDDIIYMSDSLETITGTVKKMLHQPAKKKMQSEKLTDRELDVLKQLVKGYSNKQIADELFISIHTVITHRKNISTKLGIKSIAGLTIYGVINNIIDIDNYLDTPEQQ